MRMISLERGMSKDSVLFGVPKRWGGGPCRSSAVWESAYAASRGVYQPLQQSRKEIRLLVLEPGVRRQQVCCSLQQAYLEDEVKPSYETISYVWGNPNVQESIILNGQTMRIPASAERVLRRFRHVDRRRTLWIDAVCVDQANLEERNTQVAMMYDIYSNTSNNLIWLGEEDETMQEAITGIDSIVEEMRRETDSFSQARKVLYRMSGNYSVSSSGLSIEIPEMAILRYYSSPWFGRLWVVQEAILAPRSACYRGRYSTPLEHVLRAAAWIRHKKLHLSSDIGWHDELWNAALMFDITDQSAGSYSVPTQIWNWADLLFEMSNFHASDPRDHVFGILGMARKLGVLQTIPQTLAPNYLLPISEVILKAAMHCIISRGDLSLLNSVLHRPNEVAMAGIPSWVPRFDRRADRDTDAGQIHSDLYQADAAISFDTPIDPNSTDGDLIAGGILIGQVVHTSRVMSSQLFTSADNGLQMSSIIESTTHHDSDKYTLERRRDQIPLTLTAGCDHVGHRWEPNDCREAYLAYRDTIKDPNGYISPVSELTESSSERDRQASHFDQALYIACNNRLLFIASSGEIGLGPQVTIEGDTIAILYGCNTPIILRQINASELNYEFVGECFIHGIMDGEAVSACRAEGNSGRVFRLV